MIISGQSHALHVGHTQDDDKAYVYCPLRHKSATLFVSLI